MLSARRRWYGFSLIEVIAAFAILTIVAAVIVVSVAGYDNQKRATATVTILKSLSLSLNKSNVMGADLGYLQTVLRYPSRLSHLTTLITASDNKCAAGAYNATQIAAWRAIPSYSNYNIIPLKGVATPVGWIKDTVVKGTQNGANGSSQKGYVELEIDSLSAADVDAIDLAIDDAVNASAGLLRDSTAHGAQPTEDLHLLRFLIPAPTFKRSGAGADTTTGCW